MNIGVTEVYRKGAKLIYILFCKDEVPEYDEEIVWLEEDGDAPPTSKLFAVTESTKKLFRDYAFTLQNLATYKIAARAIS